MHEEGSSGYAGEVLAFAGVSLASAGMHVTGVSGVSFHLEKGGLALVHVEEGAEHTPLANLASGLLAPDAGRVCFRGEDWAEMGARRQAEQRGCIRRVFQHYGWVANLDIVENICLSESHHTGRKLADIASEAEVLARRFGLEGIPAGRPTRVHPMTLRKLEWVRAFMGTPALVILERPLLGAPKGGAEQLLEAVCEVRKREAAVLWITDEDRVWACRELASPARYRMNGETFGPA